MIKKDENCFSHAHRPKLANRLFGHSYEFFLDCRL
jgi:hypothetical protein